MLQIMRADVVRHFGTRLNIEEAPVPTPGPAEGKVRPTIRRKPLPEINSVLADVESGRIKGRAVLDLGHA
jgi:hypothetical protein